MTAAGALDVVVDERADRRSDLLLDERTHPEHVVLDLALVAIERRAGRAGHRRDTCGSRRRPKRVGHGQAAPGRRCPPAIWMASCRRARRSSSPPPRVLLRSWALDGTPGRGCVEPRRGSARRRHPSERSWPPRATSVAPRSIGVQPAVSPVNDASSRRRHGRSRSCGAGSWVQVLDLTAGKEHDVLSDVRDAIADPLEGVARRR